MKEPGSRAGEDVASTALRRAWRAAGAMRVVVLRRLVLAAVVVGAWACGNTLYAIRISQASDAVARAEQLDAPVRAPYEYHFALEHLRKARSEAAEADFGDAERLAETALDFANRAVHVAQRVEPAPALAPPAGGTP